MIATLTDCLGPGTTPAIGESDCEHIARLSKRLLAEEPALRADWAFGNNVSAGLLQAPSLFISNNYDIPLMESRSISSHEYRMSMLAGKGDLFVLRGERSLAFETYRAETLGLGALDVVKLNDIKPSEALPLDTTAPDIQQVLSSVRSITKNGEHLNLVPYIGSENVWQLAALIAEHASVQVHVAAPPPRLTRRINDKLWFAERVREILGESALPPVSSAFGPSALAALVSSYATRYSQVVVKVPDSAGSAGNMKLDSSHILSLSESELDKYLQSQLHHLGWHDRYPVMVEVWDANVISSPSVQVWVPDQSQGLPFIEGVFDQMLSGPQASFAGASIAALPKTVYDTMTADSIRLAILMQYLGYFGRLSFDTVLCGSNVHDAKIHWIECNGRWGGVSIPMSLLNRLYGNFSDKAVMIYRYRHPAHASLEFNTAMHRLSDLLYSKNRNENGIILMNQHIANSDHAAQIIIVADTMNMVNDHAQQLYARLQN